MPTTRFPPATSLTEGLNDVAGIGVDENQAGDGNRQRQPEQGGQQQHTGEAGERGRPRNVYGQQQQPDTRQHVRRHQCVNYHQRNGEDHQRDDREHSACEQEVTRAARRAQSRNSNPPCTHPLHTHLPYLGLTVTFRPRNAHLVITPAVLRSQYSLRCYCLARVARRRLIEPAGRRLEPARRRLERSVREFRHPADSSRCNTHDKKSRAYS